MMEVWCIRAGRKKRYENNEEIIKNIIVRFDKKKKKKKWSTLTCKNKNAISVMLFGCIRIIHNK